MDNKNKVFTDLQTELMRSSHFSRIIREKKSSLNYFIKESSSIPDKVALIALLAGIGGFCFGLCVAFMGRATGWWIIVNIALGIASISAFGFVCTKIGSLTKYIANQIFRNYIYHECLTELVFEKNREQSDAIIREMYRNIQMSANSESILKGIEILHEYNSDLVKSLEFNRELLSYVDEL